MPESKPPSFPSLVQRFFTEYLTTQRAVSLRTVACYRDGLTLFLSFAQRHLGKPATALALVDLTPELILAFLDYLEAKRHNSVRSRNLRLTALRAFLKYAGRRDVSSLHVVEKALSVPMKRFDRPMLGYLTRKEMVAVLGRPDARWTSRRDHLLFTMLYNTGARVSEIIGVRVADVVLDRVSIVHLMGKGRKARSVPLWPSTAREIRAWLRANPALRDQVPLLPNRDGHAMTRSNVEKRLSLAVRRATAQYPELKKKRVSPHIIRHTTAMHLLQDGVKFPEIALLFGHETLNTTHRYVQANLEMKEKALARLEAPEIRMKRYRPPDKLLAFLQSL